MRKLIMTLLLGLLPLNLPAQTADEQTPEGQGQAIAVEADRRDTGFDDSTVNLQMMLRNKQGEESRRDIRLSTMEVDGDGDMSLSIFDRPADVKGTAFLNYTHKVGADDQWLYLPALKRVKRIASENKSGPFMGSEFAYEDISSQEVEKYTYRYIRDDDLDGVACFLIERYPVDKNSGYTRQEVWIDKAEYRPMKIVFYDRKNALLKTLTYSGYQQYLDRYWRAETMLMVNHTTGKSTELRWTDYHFRTGLTARDFDRDTLKRVR